jgi:hypothetical protein
MDDMYAFRIPLLPISYHFTYQCLELEAMLINYGFGITELTKSQGDEQVGRVPTHDDKPHNTHVQETTADVVTSEAPRAAAVSTGREREIKI